MPDQQQSDRRERLGYLWIVALLTAAVIIFNVDAIADLTRDRLDVVALVPEAGGIRVGSAVWVAGVESGRVTALSILPHGDREEVALHLRIESRVRAVVRADSDVRSVRLRFIGQPVIQVEAGSASSPPIRSGDTLRAAPRLSPSELLDRGRGLPASLDSLVDSSRRLLSLAEARRPELAVVIRRLDAATAAAGELSRQLDRGSLGALLSDSELPARLAALRERLAAVTEALGSLDRYRPGEGPEAGPLARELASLGRRIEGLTEGITLLERRVAEGEGLLARMQRDSAIEVAVHRLQARVDSLIAEAESVALRMLLP